jgi:hypothetical protein
MSVGSAWPPVIALRAIPDKIGKDIDPFLLNVKRSSIPAALHRSRKCREGVRGKGGANLLNFLLEIRARGEGKARRRVNGDV